MIKLYLLERKYFDGDSETESLFGGSSDFLDLSSDRDWIYFSSKQKAVDYFSSDYDAFCISEFNVSEDQMIKLITGTSWLAPSVAITINSRWYYEFNKETQKFEFIKSKQFLQL